MKLSILKKGFVSVLLILLFPVFSYSFGSWSQETTARELCFLYALSKDWQQTLDIAKNPQKYSEQNPILSSHPSVASVNFYFAGCAISHALISYMLPPDYSKIWQIAWIGIQSDVTTHNDENGLEQNMDLNYVVKFSIPF